MKKTALFLAFALLLPLLFACDDPDTTSGESKDDTSVSAVISDEAKAAVETIDALYKYDTDRSIMIPENISKGASYTFSRDPSDTVTDDGAKLTDGLICADITDDAEYKRYIGFVGRKDIAITLDLGQVKDGLFDFTLYALKSSTRSASDPRSIDFSVSDDGVNFTPIGTVYRAENASGERNAEYTLRLQKGISARYVRAFISQDSIITTWLYLDEFRVFTYVQDETPPDNDGSYYVNPELTKGEAWKSSDVDYNEVQNVLLNTKYTIKQVLAIPAAVMTDYYNTQPAKLLLTNGKKGGTSWSDAEYAHFTNGTGREIVFDLLGTCAVSDVTIGFFVEEEYGIKLPANIFVYASQDGEGWQRLSQFTVSGQTAGRKEFTRDFEKTTKARYIMVKFDTSTHIWCDEISVSGTKNPASGADVVPESTAPTYPGKYPDLDVLGGSENILLAYNFKCENTSVGLTDKDEYLPYVGYYDKSGKLKDTFFDSYLYLPCMTTCPSGGVLYYNSANPSIKSDWLAYEEDTFADGYNVNALEQAVGEVAGELGLDGYKAYVYMPIFSTVFGAKNFGDVDGDGVNEDFTNIEDRKKVIKWWIDRLVARYESYNYSNLTLNGFYWYHEAIETGDTHELELLDYTADYLHSLGYYFIWIPYYCASGYADWASYGFDIANMQPNYMFNENTPESQVYTNAEITHKLGMGVEIEISGDAIAYDEYLERYRTYLRAGVETGYMNTVKMYYQDAGPGVYYNAWKSTDPDDRSIYDDTYLYAKRKLSNETVELETTSFRGAFNEELTITVRSKSGDALGASVSVACRYGKVKANADGTLTYIPLEGFAGTDTFVITTGSSLFNAEATVSVTIG